MEFLEKDLESPKAIHTKASRDDLNINLRVTFSERLFAGQSYGVFADSIINIDTGEDVNEEHLFALGQRIMQYAQELAWKKNPPNFDDTPSKKAKKKSDGYVYLMKDENSGFHKIGFSKKPEYRESTLQAQTPLINLVGKVAASIDVEKKLHNEFASKRLRGEWFNLDNEDVDSILTFFQSVA